MAQEEYGRSKYQSKSWSYNHANGRRGKKKKRVTDRDEKLHWIKSRRKKKRVTDRDEKLYWLKTRSKKAGLRTTSSPASKTGSGSPGVGSVRSRPSAVSSVYSAKSKPPPKKTTPKKPVRPAQVIKKPTNVNALEHYQVRDNLGSDVTFDGIDKFLADNGYYDNSYVPIDDYSDAISTPPPPELDIPLNLATATTFSERYIDTVPVYDANINITTSNGMQAIRVRIVES